MIQIQFFSFAVTGQFSYTLLLLWFSPFYIICQDFGSLRYGSDFNTFIFYACNSLKIRVPENTYFDVIKELDLFNFTSLKLKPVSRY